MSEIRIVEYDKKLAKGIADMWNRSNASWGGSSALRTEESILNEHENSTLLTAFIAMDGEEVVGYCSFSEYYADESALFIPLLNVRPDYHGKKVGKTLVLKAVERTVEMGWPRIDLFTWAGNTKAVPVYKKCGFFWEERDDSTHLMNFIPTVLKTEAFKDFFSKAHWYNDSKRIIEVKPDGQKENGFTYFEYLWEKDGSRLRVEFEKTARGIRLVETEDYLIWASVEEHSLVFGRSYKICYNITNKSGSALNIGIRGLGDKNIDYSFEANLKVEGTTEVEGIFRLNETSKEQNSWRTHPAVISDITVNGERITFKTGIEAKPPAGLNITALPVERFLASEQECFLEIVNNFDTPAVFSFVLPESEFIKFDRTEFCLELGARERKSVTVKYTLKDFGVYVATIPVTAHLDGGETVSFNKRLTPAFRGTTGKAGWEGDNAWFMFNGPYMASLNKSNNNISLSCYARESGVYFSMPKLGHPYSSEFNHRPPERVDFFHEGSSIIMKALYCSEQFKGIELVRVAKLNSNGIFEQNYEINNLLDSDTPSEICLDVNIQFSLKKSIIPYEGRYLELFDNSESDMRLWEGSKVTENWIFAHGDKLSRGICWPKTAQMKFAGWALSFEKSFGVMKAGEHRTTDTVTVALGTYTGWREFKAFAEGKWTAQIPLTSESIEMIVNEGNPFVSEGYKVLIKETKNTNFDGSISLETTAEASNKLKKSFKEDEEIRETTFDVPSVSKGYDTLICGIDFEDQAFNMKAGVFKYEGTKIKCNRVKLNNMDTLQADNGVIQISASPDYSYGIFSMLYEGREWLDTLYPMRGPKSWWNPFVGGIGCKPNAMPTISVIREKISGDFAEKKDNKGNIWSGIKMSVKVEESENFKGLEYHQYFLMLGGLPVLCHITEVVQNTGKFFSFQGLETECFFKLGEMLKNSWIKAKDSNGDLRTYKAGKASSYVGGKDSVLLGSTENTGMLQMYVNKETSGLGGSVDVNTVSTQVSNGLVLKDGEGCVVSPTFFIFTDSPIDERELKNLRNISFDLERSLE